MKLYRGINEYNENAAKENRSLTQNYEYYTNKIEFAKKFGDKIIMIDVEVSEEIFNEDGDRNLCYHNLTHECGAEEYLLYIHHDIQPKKTRLK